VIADTATQKLGTRPITSNISTLMLPVISNAEVRRWNALADSWGEQDRQ
jgi:hypothetical protein